MKSKMNDFNILSDINECTTNNGGCADSCTNNIGSFTCACGSGYILGSDQKTCKYASKYGYIFNESKIDLLINYVV